MNSDEERNWENFLLEVATKRQEQGKIFLFLDEQTTTNKADKKTKPKTQNNQQTNTTHIARQAFC